MQANKVKVADHSEVIEGDSTQQSQVPGLMVLGYPEQTDKYQNLPMQMTQIHFPVKWWPRVSSSHLRS